MCRHPLAARPVLTLYALFVLVLAAATPAFSSSGDLCVTSDASNVVRTYIGATGAFAGNLLNSNAAVGELGIHFGATNNRVLIGHFGGGVEEFDATTGGYIKTYNAGGGTQWAGVYSPTGNKVYIGDWSTNDVRAYNATTGAFLGVFCSVSGPSDMRIGPNGNLYICSYMNGFVMEVNATTGGFVSIWSQLFGDRTNDIAFNPVNGEILVSCMGSNLVHRYDAGHNLLGSFFGSNPWGRPHGIEISPWNGNVLVADGVAGQVYEFDKNTYAEVTPTFLSPGPGDKIVDIAFKLAGEPTPTPTTSWGRLKRLYR